MGRDTSVSSNWLRLGPSRRKSDATLNPYNPKAMAGTEPVTFYMLPVAIGPPGQQKMVA